MFPKVSKENPRPGTTEFTGVTPGTAPSQGYGFPPGSIPGAGEDWEEGELPKGRSKGGAYMAKPY